MNARLRQWIGSILVLAAVAGIAAGLAAWKAQARRQAEAAGAGFPEPAESITAAAARESEYRPTTTSIGTVLALESITVRNELPGTVREVPMRAGEVVDAGADLVRLDVSVEQAELKALEAQAALAETLLARTERAVRNRAAPEADLDRARAERDVALAQIARLRAVIARKTVRAPFRGRVGLADVHPGQYLSEGTPLTTLQGVGEAVHVDFAVVQAVAAALRPGDAVEAVAGGGAPPGAARIVAVDARVDPATRNAMVRARLEGSALPSPGASVRVRVPSGPPRKALAVPATALRKSPAGDHVFVIAPDPQGVPRARLRRVRGGPLLGDEVLIVEGLSAGETVAASGSFKLRDGARVAVADEAGGSR